MVRFRSLHHSYFLSGSILGILIASHLVAKNLSSFDSETPDERSSFTRSTPLTNELEHGTRPAEWSSMSRLQRKKMENRQK
jgi:hypothetical protein